MFTVMGKTREGLWLEQQFLKWQIVEGKRRSLSQFAQYLGISQSFASQVMSGVRRPSSEMAYEWADKLGDYEILDLMNLERPDPGAREVQTEYESIPPAQREKYIEELKRFTREWMEKHGFQRVE